MTALTSQWAELRMKCTKLTNLKLGRCLRIAWLRRSSRSTLTKFLLLKMVSNRRIYVALEDNNNEFTNLAVRNLPIVSQDFVIRFRPRKRTKSLKKIKKQLLQILVLLLRLVLDPQLHLRSRLTKTLWNLWIIEKMKELKRLGKVRKIPYSYGFKQNI